MRFAIVKAATFMINKLLLLLLKKVPARLVDYFRLPLTRLDYRARFSDYVAVQHPSHPSDIIRPDKRRKASSGSFWCHRSLRQLVSLIYWARGRRRKEGGEAGRAEKNFGAYLFSLWWMMNFPPEELSWKFLPYVYDRSSVFVTRVIWSTWTDNSKWYNRNVQVRSAEAPW